MDKKSYIIANWKSNKTETEAKDWLQRFTIYDLGFANKEIIICPSFTFLSILKSYILNHKSSFRLGAQDISPFTEGSYTGEINGEQIKEFADYVIIGHSERRSNFLENQELLEKKVKMAQKHNLVPIFCIQNEETPIPMRVELVAYEPISAIGTGNPDTPENADKVAGKIKKKNKTVKYVLYGGSVTSKNVNNFTQMLNIDGVLVGNASLDASEFLEIIQNA